MWTIDFSTLIDATYWVAGASAVLSILLIVYVGALRNNRRRYEMQLREFQAEWAPLLAGPPRHLEHPPKVPARFMDALIEAWNQAQEATYAAPGDPAAMRGYLNDLAHRRRLDVAATRRVRRGAPEDRLAAIILLGHLRQDSAVALLRPLVESPNALVSLAAARALLQINHGFAPHFVSMMAQRDDWSPVRLAAVVGQARKELAAPLTEFVRTCQPAAAHRLIPLLRELEPAQALPVLRTFVSHATDTGIVALSLKVLGAIGDPADAALAVERATNEDWRVRVQVANFLAQRGNASHIQLLSDMLDDPAWWVRYRAAQALSKLTSDAQLAKILEAQHDRFARDVLTQIISERAPVLEGSAS